MTTLGSRTKEPTEERLRAIAMKRLRAIGVRAWPTKDAVRGHLIVEPKRFKYYAGTLIEPQQPFVVYRHAFFAFPPPSPLTHIGGIRFFEQTSNEDLVRLVEARWANLVDGTESALGYARRFRPDAQLDLPSWNIETTVNDNFGAVVFRFDGRLSSLRVYAVDGTPVDPNDARGPIVATLSGEPITVGDDDLLPLVRAVRSRLSVIVDRSLESGSLDLTLESIDLGSTDVASTSPKQSPSVDLDALKTGDIALSLDLEPEVAPEPTVTTIEPERMPRQQTRAPTDTRGRIHWPGGHADVVIADVSKSGVFARIDTDDFPEKGTVVFLSGIGKFAASARVAYVRPPEEAALFSTGPGVGLEFVVEAEGLRGHQDAPVCAALVRDPTSRQRLLVAFDEAGCLPIMADDLVGLALGLLHLDVRLLVVEDERAAETIAALALDERQIKVLALRPDAADRISCAAILAQLSD